MKCHLLIAALLAATALQAQTADSIDNIVLQIPKNWHADKQPEFTQLTAYSKDRFCQMAIYQKQAASADKKASFEREWSNLVLASFDAAATASPQAKKLRNGQSVLSFGAQAVNRSNNQPCYVELNMFDCGKTVQSAMLVSASSQHLQFFDSSWQSLITSVKTSGEQGVVAIAKFPFTGYWGRSSAAFNCQYDFKANGDYTFRSGDGHAVIEESGSYSIIDTQLVIMPAKSSLQQLDKKGKIIKAVPGDISRRIYTWRWQDPEHTIALQPAKEYVHDGQTGGILLSKGAVK
jgi:hypothetical protein